MVKYGVSTQTTIADSVRIVGVGVHSGNRVAITLHPSDIDTGIVFLRTELSGRDIEINALWKSVSATDLCTVVGDPSRATVATIEHLMAALRGLGVDNVLVEIDGPEVPVMDGSSRAFVDAIDQVGLEVQSARRRMIKVLKPVRVESGHGWAELRPYDGSRYDVTIDFASPLIGRQSLALDLTPKTFRRELAAARTFGFVKDLQKLLPMGLCRGSSLENSIGLTDDRVLNPDGLRFADEFVRHKMLDAVGDLALAGAPIMGLYRSYKGGHKMNFEALRALFADAKAWTMVEMPVRRESPAAEIGAGIAAPVYGPDAS